MRPMILSWRLHFLVSLVALTLLPALPVKAQALLLVGSQAPDFTLRDLGGKEVSLSQFAKGKSVVIVFWSTWSGNSAKALKRFEEYYRRYRDRGVEVIGINVDNQAMSASDIATVTNIAQGLGVTFPVLIDRGLSTFRSYDVIAVPSTVVVTEGKIAYELPGLPLVGTEDLFEYLSVLAGEAPRRKVEEGYKPRHDAIANMNLARGFVKKNKYEQAYPLFRKAIEKDPKYIAPYVELARLYAVEDKRAEAEEIFGKALAAEPENQVVMSEFGYFLAKTGKMREGTALLEKAVKKNSYTPAYYYYGYALGRDGKYVEAFNAFDEALKLNPYEPKLYLLRAEVYEGRKMSAEAAADYRKYLELVLKIQR